MKPSKIAFRGKIAKTGPTWVSMCTFGQVGKGITQVMEYRLKVNFVVSRLACAA